MKAFWGTGRRKTSVAQVRLTPGNGKIVINDRTPENFFPVEFNRTSALLPLTITNQRGSFDVFVNVNGGGISGQAGAVSLGISRALLKWDEETRGTLRQHGLLTRDPRMVERKKYGQKKARKRFQFSKR